MSLPPLSYAQRFEDFHLWRCFGGQSGGFYIDIGAGHPVYDNVSFAFYLAGWRGICVEPNPALAALNRAVRRRDHLYEASPARLPAKRRFICSANSTGCPPPSPSTRRPPRRRSGAAPKP